MITVPYSVTDPAEAEAPSNFTLSMLEIELTARYPGQRTLTMWFHTQDAFIGACELQGR